MNIIKHIKICKKIIENGTPNVGNLIPNTILDFQKPKNKLKNIFQNIRKVINIYKKASNKKVTQNRALKNILQFSKTISYF